MNKFFPGVLLRRERLRRNWSQEGLCRGICYCNQVDLENMHAMAAGSVFSLAIGALGEVLDYRLCITVCGAFTMCACWLLIWRNRACVRKIYELTEV